MIGEIINPSLKQQLTQLGNWLISHYNAVSDCVNRLLNWISGDDIGSFVYNNFRDYGIYYLNILNLSFNPRNRKTTLSYQIKNIFTDEVRSQGSVVFNDQGYIEQDVFGSAGYSWLQWNPGTPKGTLPSIMLNTNFPYPKLLTRPSNQFNEVEINQGGNTGGVVITQGGGGGSFQTTGQTKNEVNQTKQAPGSTADLLAGLSNINPLYLIGGGIVLYLIYDRMK